MNKMSCGHVCTDTLALLHAAKRAACRLVMDDSWGTAAAADPMISRAGTQHNHPRDACRIRSSSSGRNPAGRDHEWILTTIAFFACVGHLGPGKNPPPLLVFFTKKAWMPLVPARAGRLPPSCPLMHSLCFSTNHLNAQRATMAQPFCSMLMEILLFPARTSIVTFTRHMHTHAWTWPTETKSLYYVASTFVYWNES
jgi:hypothetical protein